MKIVTLKEATKELGLSPDDQVNFYKKGNKGIIEVDFKQSYLKKQSKKGNKNVFEKILDMAEDVGIDDWALNHDYYLYGTPKHKVEE